MSEVQTSGSRSGPAWVALLIGLSCLYASLPTVGPWLARRDYVETTGVIVRSETVQRQGSGMSRVRHFPVIAYRYTGAGRALTGTDVGDNSHYGLDDSTKARSVARRYPVGRSVAVHHDPTDPTRAALLRPTLGPKQLVLLTLGALAALFGAVGLVRTFRRNRPVAA